MDIQQRVGLNVQRLRRVKQLSQEELAHRAKIHQTYLSGVEGGKRNLSIIVLERIARALGADIEDLSPDVQGVSVRAAFLRGIVAYQTGKIAYVTPLKNGASMPRFYQPDLGTNLDSPFARDGSDKLIRRSYWLDMDDRTLVMLMTKGIGANLTNDEKRAHLIDIRRDRPSVPSGNLAT